MWKFNQLHKTFKRDEIDNQKRYLLSLRDYSPHNDIKATFIVF